MSNQNEENKEPVEPIADDATPLVPKSANRQIDDSLEIDLEEDDGGPSETEKLLLALGLNPKADSVPEVPEKSAISDEDLAAFAAQRTAARTRSNTDGKTIVAKSIKRTIRKVASFGTVSQKTDHVERDVEHKEGDEASEATKKRLDDQLDSQDFLIQATGGDEKKIKEIEDHKDDLKALRDELSGLFTVGAPRNHLSELDAYIEGAETGDEGATRNHDSGSDGVRIKFTSKKADSVQGLEKEASSGESGDSVLEDKEIPPENQER